MQCTFLGTPESKLGTQDRKRSAMGNLNYPVNLDDPHACNQQAEKMEPNTSHLEEKNHYLRRSDEFSFGPAKPLWN